VTATAPHKGGYRHEALFYASREDFLAQSVAYVEEGIALDEAVLIALPRHNRELLREALGSAAERVQMLEMEEAGRNPGRLISASSTASPPRARGSGGSASRSGRIARRPRSTSATATSASSTSPSATSRG
jgi:hypothetical protein